MKTAIYVRVSTNDQTTENQLPDLEALASRRGFEIVTTFAENVSAAKTRPEFDKMIAAAHRGRFAVLLVWSLDRLHRSMVGSLQTVLDLDRRGVQVVSYKEPWLDTGGPVTLLESNTYAYDKAGNRVQVGSGTTAPKNYDTNNLNQLLSERDHGRTTFAGVVDEPATVTLNGKPAKVMSTDGGAPFRFEGLVDLDAGANTVVVQAKDGQNNTTTKTYSVTTSGAAKTFEYDANGNLRFEKQPSGTVLREYRWDQQNRLVRVLEGDA